MNCPAGEGGKGSAKPDAPRWLGATGDAPWGDHLHGCNITFSPLEPWNPTSCRNLPVLRDRDGPLSRLRGFVIGFAHQGCRDLVEIHAGQHAWY